MAMRLHELDNCRIDSAISTEFHELILTRLRLGKAVCYLMVISLSNTFLNDEVSNYEIERVVKVLKPNKTVEPEEIPNKILKHNDVKLLLFDLFRLCLKTGSIPSMCTKSNNSSDFKVYHWK